MLKTNFAEWVGRTTTAQSALGVAQAGQLAATLPHGSTLTHGDAIPPLWHWSAFLPDAPMAELGRDGHPKRGGFLPAIPLDRRMWAGGQLEFLAPLHVGELLERITTIADISEKSGSAGDMVFVTLRHEISGASGLALRETQNIVYLPLPKAFRAPPKQPVFDAPDFQREVEMSEALLFRYSAATFNAHRIHYDLEYARKVEKYPGLVVHGPLQASLLMGEAMAQTGRSPTRFSFRGVHPMFCHDWLALFGRHAGDTTELCTGVPGGHQGMQATITWEA